jgi:SAM-dependent methyltransferase
VDSKRESMLAFWSDRVNRFASDPRSNTNDVWLREVEIRCVNSVLNNHNCTTILDFGCANGYTTMRLAELNPERKFLGVDINRDMIQAANEALGAQPAQNVRFRQHDVLAARLDRHFDCIYAIRVFQNIESPDMQRAVFDKLEAHLRPGGVFYYIESYADGYARLNRDREALGLALLPIHTHLTLLTDDFDAHVSKRLDLVERSWPSSSYYLVTRLVYSYIAKVNNEPIDYNHPLHQVASMIPQVGDYGPQRAALYRKLA